MNGNPNAHTSFGRSEPAVGTLYTQEESGDVVFYSTVVDIYGNTRGVEVMRESKSDVEGQSIFNSDGRFYRTASEDLGSDITVGMEKRCTSEGTEDHIRFIGEGEIKSDTWIDDLESDPDINL